MGFFSKFPYSNQYQLNLDWIIEKIKAFTEKLDTVDVDNLLRKSGGTMTGDINMDGNGIKNLKAPTVNGDAATKKYVDDKLGEPGAYLPLNGGNMSGRINMDGNPLTGVPNAVNDSDALALAFAKTLFASSGYGYGEPVTMVNITDGTEFETALDAIVATMKDHEIKQIGFATSATNGNVYYGRLTRHVATYVTLVSEGYRYDGSVIQKVKNNGVWFPFEWFNPPMVLGVEYRTTERYNGKAVYAKAVNIGTLPNNAIKSYSETVAGATNLQIISYPGRMIDTAGETEADLFSNNNVESSWINYSNAGNYFLLGITINNDLSAYHAIISFKYTKD